MRARLAEAVALVACAWGLGSRLAIIPRGERGPANQAAYARLVPADVRIELAVGALEPRVRDDGRPAVTRAGDVDRLEVALSDRAVQVDVDQVQAGDGPEVA